MTESSQHDPFANGVNSMSEMWQQTLIPQAHAAESAENCRRIV